MRHSEEVVVKQIWRALNVLRDHSMVQYFIDNKPYPVDELRRHLPHMSMEDKLNVLHSITEVFDNVVTQDILDLEAEVSKLRTRESVDDSIVTPYIGWLETVELLIPSRLAREEIGDSLERLCRLQEAGEPRWKLRMVCVSCTFWLTVNAVREICGALLGRKVSGS